MTAKYVALIVAAAALAACETAKPPEAAAPSPSIVTAPVQKRVVRGPIVPDDEPIAVASAPRAVPASGAAPAVAPATSPAAKAAAETATTASEAAGVAASTAVPSTTTPPVGETSSGVSVAELPPPAQPVQPAPANEPSTTSWVPEISVGQLQEMMNANVGGFPLWMMVAVGLVLAAALIFGMRGGRREGETYAEPA